MSIGPIQRLGDLSGGQPILPFVRDVLRNAGRRGLLGFGLHVVGAVGEGVALLLLVPILAAVGGASRDVEFVPLYDNPDVVTSSSEPLVAILVLFVALVAGQSLLARWRHVVLADVVTRYASALRLRLASSVAEARWSAIVPLHQTDVTHALAGEVDRVTAAAHGVLAVIQVAVLLLAYLAVALTISVPMTLLGLVIGAAALVAVAPARRRARRLVDDVTRMHRRRNRVIGDFVGGLKLAKMLLAEPSFVADVTRALRSMEAEDHTRTSVAGWGAVAFQTVCALAFAAFALAAMTATPIGLPAFVALLVVASRAVPRIREARLALQAIQDDLPAHEALTRLADTLDRAVEPKAEAQTPAKRPLALRRAVALDGVSYRHPDGGALSDVSLTLPCGSLTAIVGASGSGKSTIADIFAGLLEVEFGSVRVDGHALTHATRREWRGLVAAVPQDSTFINASIAQNMRLAAPTADDAAIWRALTDAGAARFVAPLKDGLQTLMGDGGTRFTGSERQRLALARALLRRPQLLVLDEPSNALDDESEARLVRTIAGLKGTTTILMITQRPPLISIADRIVRLGNGTVLAIETSASQGGARPGQTKARSQSTEASVEPLPPSREWVDISRP
ncbi:ABC transporter ATP-binding protein [Acuticoccus sediminis]|uniref:ABC transporter ATP-binding protein n=1 Tax=Acuticoccus sediminis TaxID=2184697 RepID=UPI001CFEB037|nr:ABC transporter ATP-binding protein [Acuticoccus sediminis]